MIINLRIRRLYTTCFIEKIFLGSFVIWYRIVDLQYNTEKTYPTNYPEGKSGTSDSR